MAGLLRWQLGEEFSTKCMVKRATGDSLTLFGWLLPVRLGQLYFDFELVLCFLWGFLLHGWRLFLGCVESFGG